MTTTNVQLKMEHESMVLKIKLTTMLGVIPNLQISQENGKIMITHFGIVIALHLHLMPLHEKLSPLAHESQLQEG
jgi:hypothetical protein